MPPTVPQRNISRFWSVFGFAAALILFFAAFWWSCARNPAINFLPARPGAPWIVYPGPPHANILPLVELFTEFHRSFRLEKTVSKATLAVCGFKQFSGRINGRPLNAPIATARTWKDVTEFDVSEFLSVGTNEISVKVSNIDGPPALWLRLQGEGLNVTTDETWEASLAGAVWRPARLASLPMPIRKGNRLYSSEDLAGSLRSSLPVLLLFAALSFAFVLGIGFSRGRVSSPKLLLLSAIALAIGRLVLCWNNHASLANDAGFDADTHLSYIEYVLEHASLPTASQGWEMYQPPLYYVLSALQLGSMGLSTADSRGILVLRIFGALCGIAAFLLVFLVLRLLFPDRPQRQFFGLLLAALLPASIYLCHYVTNEVLATILVAAAIFLSLRTVAEPASCLRHHVVLGLVLGAALLSKSSAVLPAAVIFAALIWNAWSKGKPISHAVFCVTMTFLLCVAVAGWHYYRVAAKFGHPLIGNWDPASGFKWWQHPGFRTGSFYLHFGQSLFRPFGSAFGSFGDGIYSTVWGDGLFGGSNDSALRPPWNYELMTVGYLLALTPTVSIITGFIIMLTRFFRSPGPEAFILLGTALLAGAALIYYSAKIPSYASVKAFYAGSVFVPLCIFAAVGCDFLWQKAGKWRWLFGFAMTLWAINTCGSFWICPQAAATRISLARTFISQGNYDLARAEVSQVLEKNPDNVPALQILALALIHGGNLDQALRQAEQAVRQAPDEAMSHLVLGMVLARQRLLDKAITEGKEALELAPDSDYCISSLGAWMDQAGRKDEAALVAREGLRIDPFAWEFHFRLAAFSSEQGDYTDAFTHYGLASKLNPDSVETQQQMEEMRKKIQTK